MRRAGGSRSGSTVLEPRGRASTTPTTKALQHEKEKQIATPTAGTLQKERYSVTRGGGGGRRDRRREVEGVRMERRPLNCTGGV